MPPIKALVVRESSDHLTLAIEELGSSAFVQRPLRVRVAYSTLNYKDGMVMKGLGRLVRDYPHVPGVDLVGEVVSDSSGSFSPGEWIIATGFRMGELYWGGYSQEAWIEPSWALRLPATIPPRRAMGIGTAGLSAMLAIMGLETMGVLPGTDYPLLVTGAAGGVGSIATALAHSLGYVVAASTGRGTELAYLKRLGASTIVARSELDSGPERPLETERWLGCIDSVGGPTLARVLAQTRGSGAVAAVGLAGGATFTSSVMPFLLRGISLVGIDSVSAPIPRRETAWQRIGELLDPELLDDMVTEIELEQLPEFADRILNGEVRGRMVVKLNPSL